MESAPQERPDLLAVIDGAQVGLEVGEVHPSAAAVIAATNLNIALNELADREPFCAPSARTYKCTDRLGAARAGDEARDA